MSNYFKKILKVAIVIIVAWIIFFILHLIYIVEIKQPAIRRMEEIAQKYVESNYGNHYKVVSSVPTYGSNNALFIWPLQKVEITFADINENEPDFIIEVKYGAISYDSHKTKNTAYETYDENAEIHIEYF